MTDTDCDGLADQWENQKFYDENGDGKKVVLPASVKWDHKDILVEIDTMVDHENLGSAINLVKNKFLTAPVSNPDSTIGINLVVVLDDKTIPHTTCTSIWSGFSSLKAAWFGTATERSSNPSIVSEKEDVYHYGVAIHSQCGSTGISGISEQPGNDLVISLGDSGWGDSDNDGHPDGNTNQQAATLMHELGHNLNLKHGGSADTPTCKPNFFSVMNHVYEFSGFIPQALIDYSNLLGRDIQSHTINESILHEPHGIVGPTGFTGAIGTSIGPPPPNHFRTFSADGSPINYDWGTDSDTSELSTVHNSINFFNGYSPCPDTMESGSFGFKDWAGIKYWDPPENIERLSNPISFRIPESVITNTIAMNGNNNTGNSLGTGNNSVGKLLDDPSLAPCDLSDPKCMDSPCDPDDPSCSFKVIFNITDPSDPKEDVGNRTAHSQPDVSIDDIKNVSKSKILYIDSLINTNLTNNTQVVNSLHKEIINDSDSILNLIQSNSYNNATLKLLKLKSLIENDLTIGIIESSQKYILLNEIENAINMLRNMM